MRAVMKKKKVISMLKKHREELVQRCERRMYDNCYFDESGALERLCIRLMELDIVIHKIEEMP